MKVTNQYISIGRFAGTHGLKGELVLHHSLGKKTSLPGLTTLFIKDKTENFIPWFVETIQEKNQTEVYLKIEGCNTKEEARTLIQKEVWIGEDDFKKYASPTAAINLLGFTILENNKILGIVEEVIEQPHQVLCRITLQGKEVLIPLHEATLQGIDHKKKTIRVLLPEGLLAVYLS